MAGRKGFPSDKQDQFLVRFPDGMRDKIKARAAENKRSMNAEIIAQIELGLRESERIDTGEDVKAMFADFANSPDEGVRDLARAIMEGLEAMGRAIKKAGGVKSILPPRDPSPTPSDSDDKP